MSETATLEPEVKQAEAKTEGKPEPPRKPRLHQQVYYWNLKQRPGPNDPPMMPDPDPCYAIVAGFGADGTVNLAILTPTGRWDNLLNVPYSHDPRGLHWTLKSGGTVV